MVVLVDTNVIIDFLATREPFYESSSQVIEKCTTGELEGCVAFHTIPNLWYILRKIPEEQRRSCIGEVCDCLKVVGASHESVVECQTAHCGRHKPCFDFGGNTYPIVPYRHLPQTLSGFTADCRSPV